MSQIHDVHLKEKSISTKDQNAQKAWNVFDKYVFYLHRQASFWQKGDISGDNV